MTAPQGDTRADDAQSAALRPTDIPQPVAPQQVVPRSGVRHAVVGSDLGELLLVADGEALAGLYFPDHRYPPAADAIGERVEAGGDDPVLATAREQLGEYFAGERRDFDVPLLTRGDAFQERVWALLRGIGYGETTTYGALAAQLGNSGLAQRVGQAVGRNPLSIVIACHRVVGAGGTLTGYAGGLGRKQALLALEEPEQARETRLF